MNIEWLDDFGNVGVGALIDPVGQVWNTDTYRTCIGPKFQDCSTKYSGQELDDCLEMMQKECIATALNQLQANKPTTGYPWCVSPSCANDQTRDLQKKINTELAKLGYQAIDVDGELGPATCGALRFLQSETGSDWMTLYGGNCKSFTDPVKIGETPPAPVAPPPTPELPPAPEPTPTPTPTTSATTTTTKKGFNWGLAALAGAAVIAIGFAVKGAAA